MTGHSERILDESGSNKRYRTIVVDPPWEYAEGFAGFDKNPGKWSKLVVRAIPYQTLSMDEIAALPVSTFADFDCRLFLWTTQRYLPAGFGLLDAWGFTYKQTIVWHKPSANPLGGSITHNSAEFLLVAVKRKPRVVNRWAQGCVITAPGNGGGDTFGNRVVKHSRKPEVFLDLIEQVSPGPYLEMFARRQRLGWDTWGDQALEHIEVAS